jgi:hypothetical protein
MGSEKMIIKGLKKIDGKTWRIIAILLFVVIVLVLGCAVWMMGSYENIRVNAGGVKVDLIGKNEIEKLDSAIKAKNNQIEIVRKHIDSLSTENAGLKRALTDSINVLEHQKIDAQELIAKIKNAEGASPDVKQYIAKEVGSFLKSIAKSVGSVPRLQEVETSEVKESKNVALEREKLDKAKIKKLLSDSLDKLNAAIQLRDSKDTTVQSRIGILQDTIQQLQRQLNDAKNKSALKAFNVDYRPVSARIKKRRKVIIDAYDLKEVNKYGVKLSYTLSSQMEAGFFEGKTFNLEISFMIKESGNIQQVKQNYNPKIIINKEVDFKLPLKQGQAFYKGKYEMVMTFENIIIGHDSFNVE